jgi:hypothetical protein
MNPTALNAIKWIGTISGVSGAMLIALNLGMSDTDSRSSSSRPRFG